MTDDAASNRRSQRAKVLMRAILDVAGMELPVRLRDVSREGALVEGDRLPIEGTSFIFRSRDVEVPASVAWVEGNRAGIAFSIYLDPESLLKVAPAPRAHIDPSLFRSGAALADDVDGADEDEPTDDEA